MDFLLGVSGDLRCVFQIQQFRIMSYQGYDHAVSANDNYLVTARIVSRSNV